MGNTISQAKIWPLHTAIADVFRWLAHVNQDNLRRGVELRLQAKIAYPEIRLDRGNSQSLDIRDTLGRYAFAFIHCSEGILLGLHIYEPLSSYAIGCLGGRGFYQR